jgi:uncharacterized Zn finger protein
MQQPIQQQLNLAQTTGITCSNCGGLFFDQPVLVRKISRLLTGTPTDQFTFLPVLRCSDCGEVLKEFFPEGMKDVEEKLGLTKIDEPKPQTKIFNIN